MTNLFDGDLPPDMPREEALARAGIALAEPEVGRTARITFANTIRPEPVVWAWKDGPHGRIPAGSLSVHAGREGTGKSSFGTWLTGKITRGTLSGTFFGTPRTVFYVAIEDSWKYTLVPRLMAAGADLSRVGRFEVVWSDGEDVTLSLPRDIDLLEQAIEEHHAALVVIDPLMSVMGDSIDTHREREVRKALDPLARLADRTGAVIAGIAHFNKGQGTDAASLITGSGAFKNVPRTVFGFARDDADDAGGRVMTQVKNSLGRDDLPSLAYRIEEVVLPSPAGALETSRLVFTGTSERSVADILRDARHDADDAEDRRDAASWIRDYLDSAGGAAPAADVIRDGKACGYKEQTLKNARSKVATSTREGFGKDQVHRWELRTRTTADTAGTSHQTVVPAGPQEVSQACRVCGEPMSYDDGTGTHVTCGEVS